MLLNLSNIIDLPGGAVPFSFELDVSGLDFCSVKEFTSPVIVSGEVRNRAGILELDGRLKTDMLCICDRCLKLFHEGVDIKLSACLVEALENEEDEDENTWVLDNCSADLDDIARTALVFSMNRRFLCREDCKGLCPRCGKDLNDGPCGCGGDFRDSRLAVLAKLLENDK